ncbi:glycoside hydrolase family 61 protein [Daldinia caldariorum]|uniref:glycoside hydrolase family 61 protein n=1 Tax=Daldinia caldariorum TaxID=326644 RepID=UPI002007B286|nr:glycoside hydrolase family 61 protein [Daldinia caldariorum]KAI1466649.1 glycoside hydrolase family 61 protein [Daldinia caldariorum]
MKSATLTALLAATVAEGHYVFSQLIVNGEAVGQEYTYIRKNSNTIMPTLPLIVDSPDLRCNLGAKPGNTTQTYAVNAGDTIRFKVGGNRIIEHPGPGFVYMSKAPEGTGVASYDGSGDWFKVYEIGLCDPSTPGNDASWCAWEKDHIEFTIPKQIPAGEYLVRVEHIGIHDAFVGRAQFYMECAQLKIASDGSGTPGPLAKIPGIYKATDPGIEFDKWNNPKANSYVMPGPAVWQP